MRLRRVLLILGAAAAMLPLNATAAHAANPVVDCYNTHWCDLTTNGWLGGWFPGGTVSIDVDVDGSEYDWRDRATWNLGSPGGAFYCGTTFLVTAPPQSWICTNIPAGYLRLTSEDRGASTHHHALGLRW